MLYTGIDYHKKYSVVSTQDATGARVCEARIDQNDPAAFSAYFQSLPEAGFHSPKRPVNFHLFSE